MRIAIDGRMISHTGIGRYIRNLVTFLPKVDGLNSYTVLLNAGSCLSPDTGGLSVHRTVREIPIYSLREQAYLPAELRPLRPDLVHYPNFNVPVFGPRPFVVTIHDLIYLLDPEAAPSKAARAYARLMLRAAARLSRKVITVSRYSRDEIIENLDISPEKVAVIHNGVGPPFRPVTGKDIDEVRSRYSMSGDYIFYAGSHHPRKNLMRLIEAYSLLKEKGDVKLAVAGRVEKKRWPALYGMAETGALKGSVLFIGEVPEGDLPALYSASSVFVFPSLYEGFGLPPLEAMACGAPVIASNRTSMPEVLGDAALTVDPLDAASIATAISKVLGDASLREALREKGFARARLFSSEEAAQRTRKVYEEALG